eukprot:1593952-Amphidinium_carterae.3
MDMDSLNTPRMKIDTPDFGADSMSLNATSAPLSSLASPSPERNSFAKPVMQRGFCGNASVMTTPPGLGGAQSLPMTPAGPAINLSPVPPVNFRSVLEVTPVVDRIDKCQDAALKNKTPLA